MESRSAGLLILVAAGVLLLLGILVYTGALDWFGRLPGDFRYESENTRVYFPLASMLLLSLVASLVVALLRRVL